MMGGGAFLLLKVGRLRPESTKQAEIGLADLRRILRIPDLNQSPLRGGEKNVRGLCGPRFPPGMANLSRILRFVS
jgi:hypothetical protein